MSSDTLPRLTAQHVRDRIAAWVAENRLPEPGRVHIIEAHSATRLGAEYLVQIDLAAREDVAPWAGHFGTKPEVVGAIDPVFRAWVDVPCPSRLPGVPAFLATIAWFPEMAS